MHIGTYSDMHTCDEVHKKVCSYGEKIEIVVAAEITFYEIN